jgi:hypothetical protein
MVTSAIIKRTIILGVALTVLLAYTFGPEAISAEYSKSRQHYTAQTNLCGNDDSSRYAPTPENVQCSNTASQTQGEDNSVGLRSSQD